MGSLIPEVVSEDGFIGSNTMLRGRFHCGPVDCLAPSADFIVRGIASKMKLADRSRRSIGRFCVKLCVGCVGLSGADDLNRLKPPSEERDSYLFGGDTPIYFSALKLVGGGRWVKSPFLA